MTFIYFILRFAALAAGDGCRVWLLPLRLATATTLAPDATELAAVSAMVTADANAGGSCGGWR